MPLLLSTWSFGLRGHAAAWPSLGAGGSALDAVEVVCRTIEADPEVDSVGRGGLPDRDGEMTLDAMVMLGPARIGAVAAVRGYPHPVSIARRVMEVDPHGLLAGPGAERFAAGQGLEGGADLLTDQARARWEAWTADPGAVDQSRDREAGAGRPIDRGEGGRLFADRAEARWRHHDTIGALALDAAGGLAGACSTSGTPFKTPGRVGDSPIVGHGLYVDPEVGAAVATGTGELIMGVCGSFLAVEAMRRGDEPAAALRSVMQRIAAAYRLEAHHQVGIIALARDGRWSGAALREGFRVSVSDGERNEAIAVEPFAG